MKFYFLIAFFIFASQAEASQIRVLLGPKMESAKKLTQSRSRSNPSSLILEFDTKLYKNIFLSIGASGEFDISKVASTGFALYGSARYYLSGNPDLVKSRSTSANFQLVEPWSYFVGLGFFQKQISFDGDRTVKDIKEDVGGLFVSAGLNYSLSRRYYLAAYASYLMSGIDTNLDYSSIEVYAGIGVRF